MDLYSLIEGSIAFVKLAFHLSLVVLSSGVGSLFCGPLGAMVGAVVGGTALWVPIQDDWYNLSKNTKNLLGDLNRPVFNFSKKTQTQQTTQTQRSLRQRLQQMKNINSVRKKIMKKMAAYRIKKFKDERKLLERHKYSKKPINNRSISIKNSNQSTR